MAEQEPKPGSLDEALWNAFLAGVGWEAGGPDCIPPGDPVVAILDAFWAWRRSTLGSRLDGPLPPAEEPVPFPWDER